MEKSEVVDTTGAGDAFIGAFLTAFVHGWKLEVLLKIHLLHSYKCMHTVIVLLWSVLAVVANSAF